MTDNQDDSALNQEEEEEKNQLGEENNVLKSPRVGTTLSYSEGATLPSNAPDWAVAASERLQQRRLQEKKHSFSVNPPPGVSRVLLHSCCAPCSGAMVEEMMHHEQIESVVIFFYNPNIHPRREYEIRKEENKKFARELGIEFVDLDHDGESNVHDVHVKEWFRRTKGLEFDAERGHRCTICFDMRMEQCALYADIRGDFDAICTTNATSRWKDSVQVHKSGHLAASKYPNLVYWEADWQSDTMTLRKYQISADRRFYKQEYCGCSYSLRDSNEWRRANGIPKIQIGGETAGLGERYFTDPLVDSAEESQEVVDEFFAQANAVAKAGKDIQERKRQLQVYQSRRKNEAHDGIINGLNNW